MDIPLENANRGWASGNDLNAVAVAERQIKLLGTFLVELHDEQRWSTARHP